jgi:hypothetical protein
MAYPCLPLALALAAFSVGAAPDPDLSIELEPCIRGDVSASGLFPTQAMEDAFESYLRWTQEQRLSPLVAFGSLIVGGSDAGTLLPTPCMADQFGAYIHWIEEEGLSPLYAFTPSTLRKPD